ncbi:sigma factor-like helix-turn-helix DNA-binding protein [Parabacteroides massiliensis]|uniref:sigma factor-like helix-turn-helix DNA-binding protein n=1 Tax=Parabacteroides massiliensis TaxID=1750560 RepID=UPI00096A4C1B|nr:sigma factor-like helix-turn-helix DNA-binding protein [Parabacteroides massiliensis]
MNKSETDTVQTKSHEEEAIDSNIIYSEYQAILQNAINCLPPQRQKIFNMSRMKNMSHKEIASESRVS